ncbi:MAG: gamma-glutamyltransferase, partial [Jannaschia sp.]
MRDFHFPGRSPVLATNGMAATSHPLGAKIAIDTLERGGNAVDAAIAGAIVLGLCEPQMTGLAGDCFVLLKPAGSETVLALNGSGRAPAAAKAQTLRAQGLTTVPPGSPHSVTVPGAIDAFCRLSAEHGKLGIGDSLGPVIRYFEEGVPVAPRVALD